MNKRNITEKLDVFFNPKSIAVFGATNTFLKWGFIIPFNIINGGYKGKIYPINPHLDSMMGYKAYPNLSAVPDEVDVAVVITPAHRVPEIIEDCGRKGVKAVSVITADFSETGPEGAALEKQIVSLARQYGMIIAGPNSMGFVSSKLSLNAMMANVDPTPGAISIASQSGNIGVQIIMWGMTQGLGFNKYVSCGNEGDIVMADYLEYFGQDPETKVIILYIEGLKEGKRFFEVAKKVTRHKPVIVFKGGKSEAGTKAVSSHTGALAGSRVLNDAMFKQCGIIQAHTTEEIIDFAYGFYACPLPRGRRVAIPTRGGGWGVIASDYCEKMGLDVPPLPPHLVEAISKILPRYWSRNNPIDVVATLQPSDFIDTVRVLIKDDSFDAMIVLGVFARSVGGELINSPAIKILNIDPEELVKLDKMAVEANENQIKGIYSEMSRLQKPVLLVGHPGRIPPMEDGTPINIFYNPERAINALAALVDYAEYLREIAESRP